MKRPALHEWLCLAGGLLLVVHYAWLLDDAYVFFKYVDNLVFLDAGLVYNEGEYVEGFSSPLWTLLLALFRSTGLGFWLLIRAVGVVSFALFWVLLVRLNRRMSPADTPVFNFPLVFLSFSYGTLCYFTSGTESPLVLLAAACYASFLLEPRSRPLEAALALSPLVRHELALPLLVVAVWKWRREGAFPARMAALSTLAVGGWVAFRVYYYADFLPNTFYLKNLVDVPQGLLYLHDTLAPYGLYLLVPLALVLARVGRPGLRTERAMMCLLAALLTLYVIKIGGGARHFRYLAFPFVLLACASAGVVEAALARRAWADRLVVTALAVFVAALSASLGSRQLPEHPFRMEQKPVAFDAIADAQHHRHHRELPPLGPWDRGQRIELRQRYERTRTGSGRQAPRVDFICWRLYQAFDRPVVHSLGLTDAFLARTDMKPDRPAHAWGLVPMAMDIARVRDWWKQPPAPGMFRAAVAAGVAPGWIEPNLETIEIVERKIYNEHRFWENLKLALSFPAKIRPVPVR